MVSVACEQVWVVTITHADKTEFTWMPTCMTVHGKKFFKITKYDRSLAKCLLKGKGLRTNAGHENSINVPFIDTLAKARQSACNTALALVMQQGEENNSAPKRKRKRAAPIVATMAHSQLLPHTVNVTMDGFNDEAGVVRPIVMSVLTKDFKKKKVWAEFTDDNIEYVARAMAHQVSIGVRGHNYGNDNAGGPVEQQDAPVEQPVHIADQANEGTDEEENIDDDEDAGSDNSDEAS